MNDEIKMRFSRWLNEKIDGQKWNQARLARASGVSKQSINGFLALAQGRETRRTSHPDISTVDAIAHALGVPLAEARQAAGYAADDVNPMKQLASEEYLLMHFRALPPDRQRDLMDQAANLYKRYGVAERAFPYLENETKEVRADSA